MEIINNTNSNYYKEYVDINFCFAYCNFNLSILDEQDYLILNRLLSLVIKYYGNYHEDEKVDYSLMMLNGANKVLTLNDLRKSVLPEKEEILLNILQK